jgi:hypothetical protein
VDFKYSVRSAQCCNKSSKGLQGKGTVATKQVFPACLVGAEKLRRHMYVMVKDARWDRMPSKPSLGESCTRFRKGMLERSTTGHEGALRSTIGHYRAWSMSSCKTLLALSGCSLSMGKIH